MIVAPKYAQEIFGLHLALGDREVASDFTLEIISHPEIGFLMKSFAIPFNSVGDAVEVPLPTGLKTGQPSQIETWFSVSTQFSETRAGHVEKFNKSILSNSNGGKFDAKIYSGTPDDYSRVWTLRQGFLKLEVADVDMENRTQLLNIPGTFSFNYFGEVQDGPRLLLLTR